MNLQRAGALCLPVRGRCPVAAFFAMSLLLSPMALAAPPGDGSSPGGGPAPGDAAAPLLPDRVLVTCAGGVERVCYLRIPTRYDGKVRLPLVLLLHGMGGTALSAEEYTGMGRKAEEAGFILACPQAAGDPAAWAVGLNAGLKDPADVDYLGGLIDELEKTLAVDRRRVFVVGHSSGAMMAYRLAAERSEKVAAIAVVAGTVGARTVSGTWTLLRAPAVPVSLIAFHGTDDPTTPYSPASTFAFNSNFMPATKSVALWASEIGCAPQATRTEVAGGAVLKDSYHGGKDGTAAVLYTIEGGDHWWPGDAEDAPYISAADQSVNATDLIWQFFMRHGRTLKS